MTDSLEFVKTLWGSMGVPGVTVPTLSLDDLDKKIADLKTVEAWLNLNMSMLRGTVQTLEVQRGTIATLKSMGATLAQAAKQPGADQSSVLAAAPFASAFFNQPAAGAKAGEAGAVAQMPNPAAWWNMLQEQFTQAVGKAMSPEAIAGATAMAQEAAARMSGAAGISPSAGGGASSTTPDDNKLPRKGANGKPKDKA